MPENIAPTPEERFNAKLEEQQQEAARQMDDMLRERLDWTVRENPTKWGTAAETRIRAVYAQKADEVTEVVQRIAKTQGAELDEALGKDFLRRQLVMLTSIKDRISLYLEVSAEKASGVPDHNITTTEELAKLREGGMRAIENIDVEYLIFQNLPAALQESYVESVGRSFRPDLASILKKANKREVLSEADWNLMVDEVAKVGANPNKMQQAEVMLVLHNLPAADRTELLRRIVAEPGFPNLAQTLPLMVSMQYVSTGQAVAVLEERIQTLQKKAGNEAEILQLQTLLPQLSSPKVRATQARVTEVQRKTGEFMSKRVYGHKNYAREFLTFKGMGSAILTALGGMTVAMNVAMNLTQPWELPTNKSLWIGMTELTGGLQMSNGLGGLVSTPMEMLAKVAKDGHEEEDDKIKKNRTEVKMDTLNYYRQANFYATYANRITQVYKAKKEATEEPKVRITLRDLGVEKKEDLPDALKPLFDQQETLEQKISEWAFRFAQPNTEYGLGLKLPETQVAFIQDTRTEAGLDPFKIYPLDPFDYKPANA